MFISEAAQELLEIFWLAEEDGRQWLETANLSAAGEASAAEVEALEELARQGFAVQQDRRCRLTELGRKEARQAIRRHRLGERLLADVLQGEDDLLEERACRLEHVLIDGLDENICTLLGHPQFCPHGKPIPPGACCHEQRSSVGRLIAPLSELQPGEGGEVAYLQMRDGGRLQKLMAMGVLPGGKLHLVRRSPSFVFDCGFSQFAVDEEIAADIYVRLSQG